MDKRVLSFFGIIGGLFLLIFVVGFLVGDDVSLAPLLGKSSVGSGGSLKQNVVAPSKAVKPGSGGKNPGVGGGGVCETRITSDISVQRFPSIYEDKIVWEDDRNGNWDVYMYDISTGVETRITSDLAAQLDSAIYGNKIIWRDERDGNQDIYMYDISTGVETRITTDVSAHWSPSIQGDRIVWYDYRNGNSDIYMYDISTGVETRLTTDASNQISPDIYGNRIVWSDQRNGNWDIYMYDISTGVETRLTTSTQNQHTPVIYADKIVWQDYRNGLADIYMYDISTGVETRITADGSTHQNPDIYANKIIWQDYRNGNWDIYMYDIPTGVETRITADLSTNGPEIYGNKIAWSDFRSGNSDIYMFDLGCSGGTGECVNPPSGLVSWWNGLVDISDVVYDVWNGNNNGIRYGGLIVVPGLVLHSFSFNGIDQYIEVPDANNLDFGTEDFSIEAWIKMDTQDDAPRHIAGKRRAGDINNGNWYRLYTTDGGKIIFEVAGGGAVIQAVSFDDYDDGMWHHVVGRRVVLEGNTVIEVYIDGERDSLADGYHTLLDVSNDADFTIGNWSFEASFDGLIDEVSVYGRALSVSEIRAIHDAGSAGKCIGVQDVCAGVDVNDLSGYPCMFVENDVLEVQNVFGTDAPTTDLAIIVDITSSLLSFSNQNGLTGNLVSVNDQEVSNPFSTDLISVGIACDNSVTSVLLGNPNPCQTLSPNEAKIELQGSNTQQILVYGYSAQDTVIAGDILVNWENYGISGREICVDTSSGSAVIVGCPVECFEPTGGLVSSWSMDSITLDNPVVDDNIDGNDGFYMNGGAGSVPGIVGNALSFDGADDYIHVLDADNLDVGSVTIEGWINPNLERSMSLVRKGYSYSFRTELSALNHVLACYFQPQSINGGVVSISSAFNEDGFLSSGWQHVACTYDEFSGIAKVYLDGVEVGMGEVGVVGNDVLIPNSEDLFFGKNDAEVGNSQYYGMMDEFSIYNRALSESEIRDIFNAGGLGRCGRLCGNGLVDDETEECDDGNDDSSDECSNECTLTYCGDGFMQAPNGEGVIEECDGGSSNDCTADCKLTFCGDGIVQSLNSNGEDEICDDGNDIEDDGCRSSCVPSSWIPINTCANPFGGWQTGKTYFLENDVSGSTCFNIWDAFENGLNSVTLDCRGHEINAGQSMAVQVYVEDSVITNCVINAGSGITGGGILVGQGAVYTDGLSLENNKISFSGVGIDVLGTSNSRIKIKGNLLRGPVNAVSTYDGLRVREGTGNVMMVENDLCTGNKNTLRINNNYPQSSLSSGNRCNPNYCRHDAGVGSNVCVITSGQMGDCDESC